MSTEQKQPSDELRGMREEELLNAYILELVPGYTDIDHGRGAMRAELLRRLKAGKEHPATSPSGRTASEGEGDRWIPISERMPNEHGEYWVWLIPHPPQPSVLDSHCNVFVGFVPYAGIVKTYDSGSKGMRFNCSAAEKPTHWQPYHRPGPPKEKA